MRLSLHAARDRDKSGRLRVKVVTANDSISRRDFRRLCRAGLLEIPKGIGDHEGIGEATPLLPEVFFLFVRDTGFFKEGLNPGNRAFNRFFPLQMRWRFFLFSNSLLKIPALSQSSAGFLWFSVNGHQGCRRAARCPQSKLPQFMRFPQSLIVCRRDCPHRPIGKPRPAPPFRHRNRGTRGLAAGDPVGLAGLRSGRRMSADYPTGSPFRELRREQFSAHPQSLGRSMFGRSGPASHCIHSGKSLRFPICSNVASCCMILTRVCFRRGSPEASTAWNRRALIS